VSGVLVGIVPYEKLDSPAPIALAVNEIGLGWFAVAVKLGAIFGLSSVMLVLVYGQTRIFYTMAKDGLLPSPLAWVHSKFKTPWVNTLVVGVIASYFAGFMSLDKLADLTNVGTLAAFMIVSMTVLYLRFTHPKEPRPFKAPLGPFTPIMGASMCFILLMSLMQNPHARHFFVIYLGVGILVYFGYGFWNSKLAKAAKAS